MLFTLQFSAPAVLFCPVGCINSKVAQFAKTLYESMKGLGTNDLSLTRTVVSRCEIDMVQIKAAFEQAYKQPLGKFIKVGCVERQSRAEFCPVRMHVI